MCSKLPFHFFPLHLQGIKLPEAIASELVPENGPGVEGWEYSSQKDDKYQGSKVQQTMIGSVLESAAVASFKSLL